MYEIDVCSGTIGHKAPKARLAMTYLIRAFHLAPKDASIRSMDS
jgi:hypothetical protein